MLTSDPNAEEIANYREVLCIELAERGKDKVLEAIALLEKLDEVLYVGPDYVIEGCASNVGDTPKLDYLNQTESIELIRAQAMITNPEPVRVAVLDTGIDATHEVLQHFVVADKSKNYVEGQNAGEMENAHLTDPHGHGTHVAGIIAATAVNVEIISFRVLDAGNLGYSRFVEKAMKEINSLWEQGYIIPIVNLSARWGPQEEGFYDVALETVIEQYPGLFVCGAGNERQYVKEIGNSEADVKEGVLVYPASYTLEDYGNSGRGDQMIVVGASNQSDNGLWIKDEDEGSNEGKFAVDIFAPGENINSCYPTAKSSTGYQTVSGTSMATPYVTGVAALIKSVHPSKSAAEIKELILANAETKSWLEGKCTTGGRLNAYDALYASHTFGPWTEGGSDYCSYRTCSECEFTEIVEHSFMKQFVNTCVFFTCAECGYYTEQHAQSPVHTAVDALTHQMTYPCCNTTSTASHTWTDWVDLDTTYHSRTCTDCGYEQLQTHRECWNSLKEMCIACKRTGPITDVVQLQPPVEEEETQ